MTSIEASVEQELIRAASSVCTDYINFTKDVLRDGKDGSGFDASPHTQNLYHAAATMLTRKFNEMYQQRGY